MPQQQHLTFRRICEEYKATYEKFKASRKLTFKPHLGSVQLNLTRPGGADAVDLSVTPLQATIILHFQDQSEWTVQALADRMKITADLLRKRIVYWVSAGFLALAGPDVYRLAESDENEGQRACLPINDSAP